MKFHQFSNSKQPLTVFNTLANGIANTHQNRTGDTLRGEWPPLKEAHVAGEYYRHLSKLFAKLQLRINYELFNKLEQYFSNFHLKAPGHNCVYKI